MKDDIISYTIKLMFTIGCIGLIIFSIFMLFIGNIGSILSYFGYNFSFKIIY